MRKRMLSLFLAIVMAMTLLPGTAWAAGQTVSGKCGSSATWSFDASSGTLTINGTGAMEDYNFDWDTKLTPWAEYNEKITSVVVSQGITHIGNEAFGSEWANGAMENLKAVSLPASLESIGNSAFACSNLTSVTLPKSLKTIGAGAFASTRLSSIHIPASVTSIGYNYEWDMQDSAFGDTPLKEITVDSGNNKYCAVDGVLYTKNMTTLVYYPKGKTGANYTIPSSVTGTLYIDEFWDIPSLRSITVPKGVTLADQGMSVPDGFDFDDSWKFVIYFSGSIPQDIGDWIYYADGCVVSIEARKQEDDGPAKIVGLVPANGTKGVVYDSTGGADPLAFYIKFDKPIASNDGQPYQAKVNLSAPGAFAIYRAWDNQLVYKPGQYSSVDFTLSADKTQLGVRPLNIRAILEPGTEYYITMGADFVTFEGGIVSPEIKKGEWKFTTQSTDPYNLGDETYSFRNFDDSDAPGHCFGMSITSAGYHNNLLDIGQIGGNANTPLYNFSKTQTVEKPICYYQKIQGSYRENATVAGGSFYLNKVNDIASDWEAVVNFVKNHDYDNAGLLQIGYRKGTDGHAINFLRYENVNGQDRIYAYDNNFPDQETYFYQDSSGNVRQAPKQTFSGAIDCIALRDSRIYFNSVGDFDATHVLYMDKDAATIQGYTYSYMEGTFSDEVYVMYEIPADVDRVTIIPNRDNATFMYMDTEYSFGKITDETHGELTLASDNSGTANTSARFKMYEGDLLLNPFTDVPINAYYYDAVQWAVENGVTTGTSATTFSPSADCTRAQIVTFLWRANGEPEPTTTKNPFTDVKATDFYYKAVLWAVEEGITQGTSATTFSPNEPCTRSQAVTFLWRSEDQPIVSGTTKFTDVPAGKWYSNAVSWAVAKDVTQGTSATTFEPNAICSRAQIVTFLYRDMSK